MRSFDFSKCCTFIINYYFMEFRSLHLRRHRFIVRFLLLFHSIIFIIRAPVCAIQWCKMVPCINIAGWWQLFVLLFDFHVHFISFSVITWTMNMRNKMVARPVCSALCVGGVSTTRQKLFRKISWQLTSDRPSATTTTFHETNMCQEFLFAFRSTNKQFMCAHDGACVCGNCSFV